MTKNIQTMKSRFSLFAEHECEDLRTKIGDLQVGLTKNVDFEALTEGIGAAAPRLSRAKGGRPQYPTVLMVTILVPQLYNLVHDALDLGAAPKERKNWSGRTTLPHSQRRRIYWLKLWPYVALRRAGEAKTTVNQV